MPLTLTGNWDEYAFGPYRVVNNVWNRGGLRNGPDFLQSITLDEATFPGGITMAWSWPGFNSSIYAYPEVILGYKPWDKGEGTLDYSARISELRDLTATFDLDIAGDTGKFNVALEMWLTDKRAGGPQAIETEVMVWLHNGDLTPAGQKVGDFSTSGYGAGIYVKKNMGDNSGKSPVQWDYIALKADADTLTGTIDLREVLVALKQAGLISGKEWVGGFELGAEVARGPRSVTINPLGHYIPRVPVSGQDDAIDGTGKADFIDGRGGRDVINGLAGDDDLSGAKGADQLAGGAGNDRLKGGDGGDRFIFDAALDGSSNVDRIVGFSGKDTIGLDPLVFAAVGPAGPLAAHAFRQGSAAGDADDRIIYDKGTGALFYDPDGTGVVAQVQFARLKAGTDLGAADFVVG